jgi:hypothetical protein
VSLAVDKRTAKAVIEALVHVPGARTGRCCRNRHGVRDSTRLRAFAPRAVARSREERNGSTARPTSRPGEERPQRRPALARNAPGERGAKLGIAATSSDQSAPGRGILAQVMRRAGPGGAVVTAAGVFERGDENARDSFTYRSDASPAGLALTLAGELDGSAAVCAASTRGWWSGRR